ncbi:unnamed protein product [Calypogeia fissa]
MIGLHGIKQQGMNFVTRCREGFLGTSQVFKNRFQNPMENGQHADSTTRDVKLMKQRSHVLHAQLKGFVQRMNTSVLKDELPSKFLLFNICEALTTSGEAIYTLSSGS